MKLNREYNDILIQIAMKLPIVKEHACEKHLVKGAEILEWETVTEIDGQPIDPDKDYLYSFPVVIYKDHLKRLQKAWKRKGPDGISEYLVWIDKLVAKHKTAVQPQSNSTAAAQKMSSWLTRLLSMISKPFKFFYNGKVQKEANGY